MERHCPDVHRLLAEQLPQPVFEFVCRLVGKRDGKNRPRRCRMQRRKRLGSRLVFRERVLKMLLQKFHVVFRDVIGNFVGIRALAEGNEVCNALNQYRRLAASCAGK